MTVLPPGRDAWEIILGQRQFGVNAPTFTQIGDLGEVRSRRLELRLNQPARFTFSAEGHSASALLIKELQHEVAVYRWDPATGSRQPLFRGVVTNSQDTLSEQVHTVNYTCIDPTGMLDRRYLTAPLSFTQTDQDTIVSQLVSLATSQAQTSSGVSFGDTAALPLQNIRTLNPDSTERFDPSGQLRDRNYHPSKSIGEAIGQLAAVINGFDYGMGYAYNAMPFLDVFFPYRGRPTADFAFVYGATVSSLTRTVNSNTYANYWRVTGESAEDQPELFAEGWSSDALNVTSSSAGLWMSTESLADVTVLSTLADRVAANLADSTTGESATITIPSYSLSLRPGAFSLGDFWLGDTVQLRVPSGRLANTDTWVRVLGITFVVSDDGAEDVDVEVARPDPSFLRMLNTTTGRLSALERRSA